MPRQRHPDFLYRRFRDDPNDIVEVDPTTRTYRLASSLFKSREVSVYSGSILTPADCVALVGGNPGVAATPIELVQKLRLVLEPDNPSDPKNPGHCVIKGITK